MRAWRAGSWAVVGVVIVLAVIAGIGLAIDYHPVSSGATVMLSLVAVVIAVTRRRTEAGLAGAEARFAAFMRHLPAAAIIKDSEGRIVYGNQATLAAFPGQPVIGQTAVGLLGAGGMASEACDAQVRATGQPVTSLVCKPDVRGPRVYQVIRFPLPMDDGSTLVGAIGVDITEREAAAEKLRVQQQALRDLGRELARVEHREREALAGELHDGACQSLALAQMKLQSLVAQNGHSDELRGIEELVSRAETEARGLMYELSPPALADGRIEPALVWLCGEFKKRHGLAVGLVDDGSDKPLGEEVRRTVYRSARELLMNVVKHAATKHVQVRIERTGAWVSVTVQDEGRGPGAVCAAAGKSNGFGLFHIRERIRDLGGQVLIESARPAGMSVTLRVPVLDSGRLSHGDEGASGG